MKQETVKLTAEEIIGKLKILSEGRTERICGILNLSHQEDVKAFLDDVGEYEPIFIYPDYDTVSDIVHFKEQEVYVKQDTYRNSFEGIVETAFDGNIYEVEPILNLKTDYVKKEPKLTKSDTLSFKDLITQIGYLTTYLNFDDLLQIGDKVENKITEGWESGEDFARSLSLNEQIGEVELTEEFGGYEGSGEEFYVVYHFKKHDIYIRQDGYYESYEGINIDDEQPYQVFPRKELTTVYEKAKN